MSETISFFHHYLIARQLHDDAHDWYDDLSRGFVNSVAAKIFKNKNQSLNREPLSTQKDLLYSIFWNEVALEVVDSINHHIALAETSLKSLEKLKIIASTIYLQSLLDPLKKSARDTLSERSQMLDFLEAYAQKFIQYPTQTPTAQACTSP